MKKVAIALSLIVISSSCAEERSIEQRVRACDPSLSMAEEALHYHDKDHQNILMMASEVGCLTLVQSLVKKMDVNEQTIFGTTALTSSTFGTIGVMKALIDSGIDIYAKDSMGHTALINTVEMNKYRMAELLLKRGIDPNEQDNTVGITPLHMAVMAQRYSLVELLLKYGADPTIKAKRLGTPLDLGRSQELTLFCS